MTATYLLLSALLLVNALFVWHLDRKDRRHQTTIDRLCQRLQAPEQAVLEHSAQTIPRRDGPVFDNEFAEDERALEALVMSENGDHGAR